MPGRFHASILSLCCKALSTAYHLQMIGNVDGLKTLRSEPVPVLYWYLLQPFPRPACTVAPKYPLESLKLCIPPLVLPLIFRENWVGL